MAKPTLRRERPSSPAARALIIELDADLLERYPNPLAGHYALADGEIAPGDGVFLIAAIDGEDVACGAIRRIDPMTGELKRMYVRPSHRGRGIAQAVLRELEAEARDLKFSRVVLETGERSPAAIALYRSAGYELIPKYGIYVDSDLSICMAKTLSTSGSP